MVCTIEPTPIENSIYSPEFFSHFTSSPIKKVKSTEPLNIENMSDESSIFESDFETP